MSPYLTAEEAAATLEISKATLYAYTSRAQLRSEPVPGRPRERRYLRQDVERLQERKEARRDPSKAAARGLHWGSPVLESGITLIEDGRLYYRGRDVMQLMETAGLEQIAELLWDGAPVAECPLTAKQLSFLRGCTRDPLAVFQMALPLAAAADPAGHDLRAAGVRQTGVRILRLFVAAITGRTAPGPAHVALRAAWAPKHEQAGDAIRKALVLCADHELNASAFTARCAASTGASPYDVITAALAALRGSRHGGATERASALFAEARTPHQARSVVASRLRRGEALPGFGHPLYPDGDPRARLLLQILEAAGNRAEWRLARSLWKVGAALLKEEPNLDFALVALARTYRLPAGAPLILFALGRTAGWIAHAMEQYAAGELIRPRARYTGPMPLGRS
ncbi:MAG TPA: citrate synthase family protein [Bryobacteraceae bacterium]